MKNIEIRKYDYIDSLRGFAILGVVFFHVSLWVHPTTPILSAIANEGTRGVQLFFVASALTLFLSMAARTRGEDRPTLNFFIRRFFRIAPAFYCAIIIYTLYNGMSARVWAPNGLEWWYIPVTAIFMHGWYPETINSVVPGGWTIAVEMTFYILLPYLFRRLTSIKSTLIALLLALIFSRLISISAGLIISPYYPENQHYLVAGFKFFWFFSQFPVFIWGILVFHLINKYPHCDKKTALFMLFSAIYLLLAFMHVDTYFSLIPHHVLYGLFFALFSLSLHYSPQIFFVNRVTVLLGKLSFSIYLVHFMVLKEFKKLFSDGFLLDGNIGFITAFIFVLAVSVCISYVTHRAIEIPGINLGKFIIKKL